MFVYNIIILLFARLRGSGLRVYRKSNIILMSWVAPVAVKSAQQNEVSWGYTAHYNILLFIIIRVLLLCYMIIYYYFFLLVDGSVVVRRKKIDYASVLIGEALYHYTRMVMTRSSQSTTIRFVY